MDLETRVPMSWPCGPLEIERRGKGERFTPREAEALRAWARPEALDLLAGSPVNTLVMPWAEGSTGDEAHQQALLPLVSAAGKRGLSVVGRVAEGADLRRAAGAARSAGLAALATGSRETVDGVLVLRFRPRGFGDRTPSPFLGDAGATWPGLRPLKRASGVDAMTGATGRPWIDSNAWYVRLARALLRAEVVWLDFDPPDTGRPVRADAYRQAIADGEVVGARWVVSLDEELRADLVEGRPAARETWAAIARSLAFFRDHAAWAGYDPVGQIGVLSDFAGGNEFLSFELLNLLARRSGLFRPLDKGQAAAWDGLDALVYADEAPPGKDLAKALDAFAEAGGTVVAPPGWEARGPLDPGAPSPRFRVHRRGRGRLAVSREAFADPDLLAEDVQLLTSHRRDRVRVFNLGVGRFHHAASPDGRSGVLHVLAYPVPYPRMAVAAWFRRPWASGRGWMMEREDAVDARRVAVENGVEFHLPPVPLYCALEVSG